MEDQSRSGSSRIQAKQAQELTKMLAANTNKVQEDLSVTRPSIQVSVSGFKQAIKAAHEGTNEVKHNLIHECNVIYECKVCLNLFRSLANFISHKRCYCQLRYEQTRHKDVRECAETEEAAAEQTDLTTAIVYVVPEDAVETIAPDPTFNLDNFSPTLEFMKEAGIVDEIENKALFTQLRRNEKSSIENVAKRLKHKVDQSFDADYYATKQLKLERMRQNQNAVFQTYGTEGPSMGERYLNWQTEKHLPSAFVGPNGKALRLNETPSVCSDSSKENHSEDRRRIVNKYLCPICNIALGAVKSFKRHLKNSHGKIEFEIPPLLQNAKSRPYMTIFDEDGKIVSSKPYHGDMKYSQQEVKIETEKGKTCTKCKRIFSKFANINRHIKVCKGLPQSTKTSTCTRISSESQDVSKHKFKFKECSVILQRIDVEKEMSELKPSILKSSEESPGISRRTLAKIISPPKKRMRSEEDEEVSFDNQETPVKRLKVEVKNLNIPDDVVTQRARRNNRIESTDSEALCSIDLNKKADAGNEMRERPSPKSCKKKQQPSTAGSTPETRKRSCLNDSKQTPEGLHKLRPEQIR